MGLFSNKKTSKPPEVPDMNPANTVNNSSEGQQHQTYSTTPSGQVNPSQENPNEVNIEAPNPDEFAKKPSNLSNPIIRRAIKVTVIFFAALLGIIIAIGIFQVVLAWVNRPPDIPQPDPKPEPTPVETTVEKAKYAYVKDRNSIWVNCVGREI